MTSKDVPPMLVNVNSRPMLSDICKLFEASGERFKALSGGSLPFDVKVPRADAEHFNVRALDSTADCNCVTTLGGWGTLSNTST